MIVTALSVIFGGITLESWEKLQTECLSCRRCALAQTRTNVVFGMGNRKNKVDVSTPCVPETLFAGTLADPHSVLGIHEFDGGMIIRVYDPLAESVEILSGSDFSSSTPMKNEGRGLFSAVFKDSDFFAYRMKKIFSDGTIFTSADPYSFLQGIGEMDTYLFNLGEHRNV